jgi:hypothetical protein
MGVTRLDLVEVQNGECVVWYRYDAVAEAGPGSVREYPTAAGIGEYCPAE